jgi:hypothetical protein
MKISEELRNLHLHDAVVYHMRYSPQDGQLIMDLRQCDWLEDDDGERGLLTFYGVERLKVEPPLDSFEWVGENFAEIYTLEHDPDNDAGGLEAVSGLMDFCRFPRTHTSDDEVFVEMSFLAREFEWQAAE